MKTYLITWYVLLQDGSRINSKKPSRITFCNNELHAKMKLEDYLKRTIPNFDNAVSFAIILFYFAQKYEEYFKSTYFCAII